MFLSASSAISLFPILVQVTTVHPVAWIRYHLGSLSTFKINKACPFCSWIHLKLDQGCMIVKHNLPGLKSWPCNLQLSDWTHCSCSYLSRRNNNGPYPKTLLRMKWVSLGKVLREWGSEHHVRGCDTMCVDVTQCVWMWRSCGLSSLTWSRPSSPLAWNFQSPSQLVPLPPVSFPPIKSHSAARVISLKYKRDPLLSLPFLRLLPSLLLRMAGTARFPPLSPPHCSCEKGLDGPECT